MHVPRLAAALGTAGLLFMTAVPSPLALAGTGTETRHTVVLSLQGLDCASCWDKIRPALQKIRGVKRATFDRRAVEASLELDRPVAVETLIASVEKSGFHAVEGPGHGRWLPPEGFPEGADVALVTDRGEDVPDLESLAVLGKVTVVDFYAPWCGPCRAIAKHLAKRMAGRKDLAVRQINIVDWETPVARRHLKGVSGIPFLVVLGKDGKRVTAIQGLALSKLDQAIARGGAQ